MIEEDEKEEQVEVSQLSYFIYMIWFHVDPFFLMKFNYYFTLVKFLFLNRLLIVMFRSGIFFSQEYCEIK